MSDRALLTRMWWTSQIIIEYGSGEIALGKPMNLPPADHWYVGIRSGRVEALRPISASGASI